MKDTKLKSFIESLFNIIIGLLISIFVNAIVFPLFGFYPSVSKLIGISSVFTVISLTRAYLIRRLFVNGFYETIFKRGELNE